MDQDIPCSYYALLVGINAYSEKPLRGCIRDVHEIKKYLKGIPKPGVQIHILTASLAADTTFPRLTEEPEFWPTHRNVVKTINHIIYHAKEGDFVYIHFSGHGTAFRPPRESSPSRTFSNPSTGDLALNLLQEDGYNIRYLRGSELAYLLKRMVDKKLIVTLVLDCCFSGSMMRNDASVRYLDYNRQIDAAYPPVPEQNLGSDDKLIHSAYRNASLVPNWLVNPDGYTVITACGPTEVAKEIRVDGQTYGALSYFLANTFEKLGGIGGKQQHIHQYIRAKFREMREKYRHIQNSMLYGNRELYFFGLANLNIGPVPIPVIKNQGGGFQLDAGQAHGICEGDIFTVCPVAFTSPTTRELLPKRTSMTAEVTSVRALTSDLNLSESLLASDTTLVATPITHLSLQRFPIRLDLGVPHVENWAKALTKQQGLYIYNGDNQSKGFRYSFAVAMEDHESYKIQDETGRTLLCLPASSIESNEDAAQKLESIEHLAKFELFKFLKNSSFDDSTNRFRNSFNAQIIKPSGDRINPGCSQGGQYERICSHPECLVEVEDGASLQLEVVNNETEGGYALCLHIYNVGSSWEIKNVLRGDYEVIPPLSTNKSPEFRKGSSGKWSKRLKMTVPSVTKEKGEKYCDDIIKVFLTSQPTSFSSLELPEFGKMAERNRFSNHRSTGGYSPSEDWIALNFRIRTRTKGV